VCCKVSTTIQVHLEMTTSAHNLSAGRLLTVLNQVIIASLLNHQTLVGVFSKQPEHISYEYLETPKVYEKNESAIKCVFHFTLQLLFIILDACRNVSRSSREASSVFSMF